MRLKLLYPCLIPILLWGCDTGGPSIEPINSRNKVINCTLNGSPLKIEITKGSLDANLFLGDREVKVNLLEVKDSYQILMRFDPQIGQLKMNKMGNELIQVKNGNEQTITCVAESNKS
jgi:hypothetical protein